MLMAYHLCLTDRFLKEQLITGCAQIKYELCVCVFPHVFMPHEKSCNVLDLLIKQPTTDILI